MIEAVRGRRKITAEQALSMLALCPGSDIETKRSLTSMAGRSLADRAVAGRWIELAASETDSELREAMVARLFPLDFRQIPDLDAFVKLLLSCLAQDNIKPMALACLGRIVVANPAVIGALAEAYDRQRGAHAQRQILFALSEVRDLPGPLVEFFLRVLPQVDADIKATLVDRLLARDAIPPDRFSGLLERIQPVSVKLRVLDHLIDRSIAFNEAAVAGVLEDPEAACRAAAIELLASRGACVEAILQAARGDPDAGVRRAALFAFEHSLPITPAVIDLLLQALRNEKSAELAAFILRLLTPHVGRSPKIRDALAALLRENLRADIATAVYAILGALLPDAPALHEAYLRAYESDKDDWAKAAILQALARLDPDERLVRLYQSAMQAPDPQIKTWGLAGLLRLPMSPANVRAVASGASVLLVREVDPDLREALARKIARIPGKSPALVAQLKDVAQKAGFEELRKIAEDAYNRAVSESGDSAAVDWDLWYRRVDVEKRANGIFPDLFIHYDSNPPAAQRILRAAMRPDCDLYGDYGYNVNAVSILAFLKNKNAIDDDASRFCVNWLLSEENRHAGGDSHLEALGANPAFPELKESLWTILEARDNLNVQIFRDLLVLAYGSDEEAGREVRRRAAEHPPKPYVRLLEKNIRWPPAEEILVELQKRRLDAESADAVREALAKLGRDVAKEKPAGPGFADE